MKTKRFFQISLAVAATAMLAACGKGGQTPTVPTQDGTLTNIQNSRPNACILQPVTISADYKPSKGVDLGSTKAAFKLYQNGKVYDTKGNAARISNGKVSRTFGEETSLKPGEYKIVLMVLESISGQSMVLKDSMNFTISDKHADVRNSFWRSNQDVCLEDIQMDNSAKLTKTADKIAWLERDVYHARWEWNPGDFSMGERTVNYNFENNQLTSVVYYILPHYVGEPNLSNYYFGHIKYLQLEYDNFGAFTYKAILASNFTPSAEEQALIDKFNAGDTSLTESKPLNPSPESIALSKLVTSEKVQLTATSTNKQNTTNGKLETVYLTVNEWGFKMTYTPTK